MYDDILYVLEVVCEILLVVGYCEGKLKHCRLAINFKALNINFTNDCFKYH